MLNYIKRLSLLEFDITNDDLELFTRCFKNLVGHKRGQLRKIEALIERDKIMEDIKNIYLLNTLMKNLNKQIKTLCEEIIQISSNFLSPIIRENKSKKCKLFFLKTIADHYRYLYELNSEVEYKEKSKESYSEALICAENDKFSLTDMTYLTFYLNYSVFLHDILEDRNEAIKSAKSVLHSALKETEEITDNQQKDIILLCQMIKDNLSLWKNEIPEELLQN
jgi:14-3-3 protein epsilon